MRYYSIIISQGTSGLGVPSGAAGGGGSATADQQSLAYSNRRISPTLSPFTKQRKSLRKANPFAFVSTSAANPPDVLTARTATAADLAQFTNIVPVPSSIAPIAGAGIAGAQWTSVVYNENDPGALDIELDITQLPGGAIYQGWLKVYGIDPIVISQSTNFNYCNIQIYAGFTDGLPLATYEAKNQGCIADGVIFPCWGNWIGNELSIEFNILNSRNGLGGPRDQRNIIHNMPAGTTLGDAIKKALSNAYPDKSINVNISNNLVLGYDDKGFYQSLPQYQNYYKSLSHNILGTPETTGYLGVTASPFGDQINITDGSIVGNHIKLAYADLIGQPTWSPTGNQVIQVKTALRGDIFTATSAGNVTIELPPNLLVQTPSSSAGITVSSVPGLNQHGNVLNFHGNFVVLQIRHVGKFRQPTGESWVTIIDAAAHITAPLGQGGIGGAISQ
jgi:hypothetical protein